jgi:4-hydroxyproline epimerase
MKRVQVIDSHTGGEPTRVVISGGPDLGTGSLAEQAKVFQKYFDSFRSAVVNEPRGSDVLVGALLTAPVNEGSSVGVIFFNNVGPLGMCGHGTIGLVATLAHLGRLNAGDHYIDTPVGTVMARLHEDGQVSVTNVPSWRKHKAAQVTVPSLGTVTGDVAWAGNWFFLVTDVSAAALPALQLENIEQLTAYAWEVRQAVNSQGYPEVDHVEFFGPPQDPAHHSRNFVLCPGKAYDRSPCGTGTSAKLACLAADGKLAPGEVWHQESVIGSVLSGTYVTLDDQILPTVTGRAWVNAEATLLLNPEDPFCHGISPQTL